MKPKRTSPAAQFAVAFAVCTIPLAVADGFKWHDPWVYPLGLAYLIVRAIWHCAVQEFIEPGESLVSPTAAGLRADSDATQTLHAARSLDLVFNRFLLLS